MNFLIKKVAFFSLLVITFFACEEPGEIGLDIKNPGQSFGVLFTDTLTVRTSTIVVDSVLTSRSGYLMAGQYTDPQLGVTKANSFFQISPRDSVLNLGESPTLDSLVLYLHESYSYGADTSQVQQFSVHVLTDSVRAKSYINTDALPYAPNAIGYRDNVLSTPRNQSDTVKITIDASLWNTILPLNGKSFTEFYNAFYGLALIPGTANNMVINFNASSTNGTKLRLYYKNPGSATQKVYDFAINPNFAFNQVTSEKSNTPLANLQVPYQPVASSQTGEETFIQGGTGIMTKIDLPYLRRLAENKTIRLNQAFLTVQPVQSRINAFAPPPSQLIIYQANSSGNPLRTSNGIYVPIGGGCSSDPTILYDSNNRYYKVDITRYLQLLLDDGDNSSSSMYLAVPSFSLNSYINTNFGCQQSVNFVTPTSSLESSVSKLAVGSQQHPLQPLKLEVYYTEVK